MADELLDEVADNLHYLLDEPEEKSKNWINRYYTEIFWSNKNKETCGTPFTFTDLKL
jgi:hypothetical protein